MLDKRTTPHSYDTAYCNTTHSYKHDSKMKNPCASLYANPCVHTNEKLHFLSSLIKDMFRYKKSILFTSYIHTVCTFAAVFNYLFL